MKLLVTGATGFIGRNLIPHLLENNIEVALLVREAYGMGTPLPPELAKRRPDIQLVYADLRNFSLTKRAVLEAAPSHLLHLAAFGVTDPFMSLNLALRHNVNGTLNLLRAAFDHASGIEKLVVARTPGETTAMNVYAASKAAAWQFCQLYANAYQHPVIGAMIFQAYGWGQNPRALIPSAFRAALANENFPMTEGWQEKDFIYIDDVIHGLWCAIQQPLAAGTTVELGTGQTTAVRDVVSKIYQMTESTGEPLFGRIPNRPGENPVQLANAQTAAGIFNWQPKFSINDGLLTTLTKIRTHSHELE